MKETSKDTSTVKLPPSTSSSTPPLVAKEESEILSDDVLAKTSQPAPESAGVSVDEENPAGDEFLAEAEEMIEPIPDEGTSTPRRNPTAAAMPGAYANSMGGVSSRLHNHSRSAVGSILQTSQDTHSVAPAPGTLPPPTRERSGHGLAVANPVTESEQFNVDNLPRASEHNENERKSKTNQNKYTPLQQLLLLLFMGGCLIIVVLVLALTDWNGSDKKDPIAPENSTEPPSPEEASLEKHVLSLLPVETLVKIQNYPGSPQEEAFHWILQDPYLETYSETKIRTRFALATLYYSTNGDDWTQNTNWLSYEEDECSWYQKPDYANKILWTDLLDGYLHMYNPVAHPCPSDNQTLQNLWLDVNELKGKIPWQELAMVGSLTSLSVGWNQLTGSITSHVGQMTNLEALTVSYIQDSAGSIPPEIGQLTKLRVLDLGNNYHTGTMPTEMMQLTNLEYFALISNPELQGTVPAFEGFSNLTWVVFILVGLSGTIPSEIGLLTDMEWISFGLNKLSGTIPTEIGMFTKSGVVSCFGCGLSGTLPTEMGQLTSSTLLSFRINDLTGTIPSELGLITGISNVINVQYNQLTGTIPTEMGNFGQLRELTVLDNHLTGTIPSELGRLTSMERLSVANNSLTGTVPTELEFMEKLYILELGGNDMKLEGVIPEGLCGINGTCQGSAINDACEEETGVIFDCSPSLCGCECSCSQEPGSYNLTGVVEGKAALP